MWEIRAKELNNEGIRTYGPGNKNLGSIKIQYGGQLISTPTPTYYGGDFSMVDKVRLTTIILMDVYCMVERLGMRGMVHLYHVSEYKSDDSECSIGDWSEKDSEYDEADDDKYYVDFVASLSKSKAVEPYIGSGEGLKNGKMNDNSCGVCIKHGKDKEKDKLEIVYTGAGEQETHSDGEGEVVPDSEDDFASLHGSDEDNEDVLPTLDPAKELFNPNLYCGLYLNSLEEAKIVIRSWNIARARPWRFEKMDDRRVSAFCPEPECPWLIYVTKSTTDHSVRITKFVTKHTCEILRNNPKITSGWVGLRCVDILKENPNIKPRHFKEQAQTKHHFWLTDNQAGHNARTCQNKVAGELNEEHNLKSASIDAETSKIQDDPKRIEKRNHNQKGMNLKKRKQRANEESHPKEQRKKVRVKMPDFSTINEPPVDMSNHILKYDSIPVEVSKNQECPTTTVLSMSQVKNTDAKIPEIIIKRTREESSSKFFDEKTSAEKMIASELPNSRKTLKSNAKLCSDLDKHEGRKETLPDRYKPDIGLLLKNGMRVPEWMHLFDFVTDQNDNASAPIQSAAVTSGPKHTGG
ncbi:OLC1v1010365C1 [Oldenlandia corymbosa var. corymbosa]|uniref:OLC1v1010365C1 n=1 Tax=Oldenlandia corymbosa var. corymbosa TaxID=529605 RepID=A0AAV1DSU6_OLDCO|nr:OLC1v1010365C1 [Oldenlandia corymbosa var. corymbosa]